MTPFMRQLVLVIFGAVLSALFGMGVSALQKISEDVAHLDQSVAVIVTQMEEFERRLTVLEKVQESGKARPEKG